MDSITDPAAHSAASRKPTRLINRAFGLLWLGGAVSAAGDVVYDFTLIVWITLFLGKGRPWAPLAVSGVLVASLGTMCFIGPVAGVFVDRWDKRRTMLWMDAARVALIALLIPATNAVPLPLVPGGRLPLAGQLAAIYTIVFLASLCGQFFIPAKIALISDLVPDAERARASGLSQAAQSVAFLLGPAFAPVLALAFGVEWAIAINALSFAFSFLMIALIRAPRAAAGPASGERSAALREFRLGVAFTARSAYLSVIVVACSVVALGAAAINALDIFFALNNLHAPPEWYGLLSSALGVGMLAGAVLAGALAQRAGLARMFTLSLLATGALVVAYSRMTSFAPGLALIFVAGIFQTMLNTVAAPLLLRVTPRAYIGRVASLLNAAVALMQLAGTLLTGYLAGTILAGFHLAVWGVTFGPFDLLIGCGGALILLGALYALVRLGLRDPDPALTTDVERLAGLLSAAPTMAPALEVTRSGPS